MDDKKMSRNVLKVKSPPKDSLASFSRADFRKTLLQKSMASLSAVSTAGALPLELRCFKHSPRVVEKKSDKALENLEFEAKMWRQAFDSMGALQRLNLSDFVPFTTLNKSPYHCLSLSRRYKVSYGKISQVEGGTVKGFSKPKEVKSSICNCIESVVLPRVRDPFTVRKIIDDCSGKARWKVFAYTPISCVLVWWDSRFHNVEKICEWLQCFGSYLFTIHENTSTLLVCFDTMTSAYRAVNNWPLKPGIRVSWKDIRLYNNGYYRKYQNYSLSKDAIWVKHFTPRKKSFVAVKSSTAQYQEKRANEGKLVKF